jgi:RNAse (barnase) inhibitor barstar
VKELVLNAEDWNTKNDFYDAFFTAVGAPPWHGRNFDALNDSIATGRINAVEVPYRIVIRNYDRIGTGAVQIVRDFVQLILEISDRGCPVQIRTENSNRR